MPPGRQRRFALHQPRSAPRGAEAGWGRARFRPSNRVEACSGSRTSQKQQPLRRLRMGALLARGSIQRCFVKRDKGVQNMARLIVPAVPCELSSLLALSPVLRPVAARRCFASRHVTLCTQDGRSTQNTTHCSLGPQPALPSLPTTAHSVLVPGFASPSRVMRSLSRSSGTPRVSGTQRCTKPHLGGAAPEKLGGLGQALERRRTPASASSVQYSQAAPLGPGLQP